MDLDNFALQVAALKQRIDAMYEGLNSQNLNSYMLGSGLPKDIVVEELKIALEELQVAEEALREQNDELQISQLQLAAERQRYLELFELAPDGYLVTDVDGRIQEANQVAASLLGVSQATLVGKPITVFISAKSRSEFRRRLAGLIFEEPSPSWEVQLQSRQGRVFEAALTVSISQNVSSNSVQMRWLLRDVTYQKQMERDLLKLNDQLVRRIAFEETLTSILGKLRSSLDEQELLQIAVQELTLSLQLVCCSVATYSSEEAISNIRCQYTIPGFSEAFTSETLVEMTSLPHIYYQLFQRHHFQFCNLVSNTTQNQFSIFVCPIVDHQEVLGDLWCFSEQNHVLDENQTYLVQQVASQCAIALRQARLYAATQAQIAELESLNRLKDNFVSTVSHELRTPLTNIKMAIHLMKGAPTPEQSERYLQILEAECQQEINVVTDLLDLQKLETEQYPVYVTEAIDLQDWLATILVPFRQRVQARQQIFHLNLSLPLPIVYTDAATLRRILLELLQNAHKYTQIGGEITLTVEYSTDSAEVLFIVRNQAEIPTIHLPQIFNKFYRAPQKNLGQVGGTGLGLTLVKKLIEYLEGDIKVESNQGWTTFEVTIPNLIITNAQVNRNPNSD